MPVTMTAAKRRHRVGQGVFNLLDPLEQFFKDPTFTGVRGDEVEDKAIRFLTVPMNAAHTLFKADRVPRDVVIDHQPAELEVDPLTSSFCGDEHLA